GHPGRRRFALAADRCTGQNPRHGAAGAANRRASPPYCEITMSALVLVATNGPVTTLTMNRPDKRNALNVELLEQLCAAISAAEADAGQRVVVLRGAGAVFCSGLDLAEAAQPDRAHL